MGIRMYTCTQHSLLSVVEKGKLVLAVTDELSLAVPRTANW